MIHRRRRRGGGVWTGLELALATLGLQATLSCAPPSTREFVTVATADGGPTGQDASVPEVDAGPTGGPLAGPDAADVPSVADAPIDVSPPDGPAGEDLAPSPGEPDAAPAPTPVDAAGDTPGADSAAAPEAPVVNLSQGLVSRWKLDEPNGNTTADSAGGNVGMISGAARNGGGFPVAQYDNPGSLRFDGDNDFVSLGTGNLPANNRPQSVVFWFNVAEMPTDPAICVSLTDGMEGGSRLKIGFRDDRVSVWKRGSAGLVTGPAVAVGWHHYAYTFSGTAHTLYVDGQLADTSTTAPDTGAVAVARLGSGHDNSENFAGLIDEVRVYNRALNAGEVAALATGRE